MLRSISILFTLILFLISVTGAAAQQSKAMQPANPKFIRFSVTSSINPSSKIFDDLPTGILDKLIQYNSLERVDLHTDRDGHNHLEATFEFSELQNFKEWYSSKDVKALLTNLRKEDPSSYGININIQLPPEMRK